MARPGGQRSEVCPDRPRNAAQRLGRPFAISRAECGSITALVSACGVPAMRTIVWQIAWCTAMPVEPEA